MGILLDIWPVRLGVIIALTQFTTAGSTKAAPEVTDLMRSGKETLEKLPQKAAAWTARCQLPNGAILDIDVLRDGGRQSWNYIQFIDRRPVRLCDIIQAEGAWQVRVLTSSWRLHVLRELRRVKMQTSTGYDFDGCATGYLNISGRREVRQG
jgi:hypothetical protein